MRAFFRLVLNISLCYICTFSTGKKDIKIVLSQSSRYFFWELYHVKGRAWHEMDVDWVRLLTIYVNCVRSNSFSNRLRAWHVVTLAMCCVVSEMSHFIANLLNSVKLHIIGQYIHSKKRNWKKYIIYNYNWETFEKYMIKRRAYRYAWMYIEKVLYNI